MANEFTWASIFRINDVVVEINGYKACTVNPEKRLEWAIEKLKKSGERVELVSYLRM